MKIILVIILVFLLTYGCVDANKQINPNYPQKDNQQSQQQTVSQNIENFPIINGKNFLFFDENNEPVIRYTISAFESVSNPDSGIKTVYLLLLSSNVGKQQIYSWCSDFTIIDDQHRSFQLQNSIDRHFSTDSSFSSQIQPGLAIYQECMQVMPIDTNLEEFKIIKNGKTITYPLMLQNSLTPFDLKDMNIGQSDVPSDLVLIEPESGLVADVIGYSQGNKTCAKKLLDAGWLGNHAMSYENKNVSFLSSLSLYKKDSDMASSFNQSKEDLRNFLILAPLATHNLTNYFIAKKLNNSDYLIRAYKNNIFINLEMIGTVNQTEIENYLTKIETKIDAKCNGNCAAASK